MQAARLDSVQVQERRKAIEAEMFVRDIEAALGIGHYIDAYDPRSTESETYAQGRYPLSAAKVENMRAFERRVWADPVIDDRGHVDKPGLELGIMHA